ncbi:rna-directed dna polymerase from mobile element jockey-like [Pitangus sulphuratus]|nr:rna-directed dna polymerase from mobile element jockey-like [Pitangus sulphuratus]
MLGPVLFNIFIYDLDAGLEEILSEFADDTKLGGAVDSLKGREALQKDLNKSEDWAITNHRKFSKGKCQILHLGRGNLDVPTDWGMRCWKGTMGVLVNGKLNMSQQCPGSQEGQPCPGRHQAKHHQPGEGRDCPTLLCTGEASP